MRPRFPQSQIPNGGPSGLQYQRAHAMGAIPAQAQAPAPQYHPDQWEGWSEIPAFYTVTLFLDPEPNKTAGQATPLRPEPFVLKRITTANTGDVPTAVPLSLASAQGRQVEVTWQDEFTRFFGEQPCLLAAAFGDSSGYLDLPAPVLFQGRQSLQVNLRRLAWPFDPAVYAPVQIRFDFQFQGVALLPPGTQSSGSVR